MDLPVKYWYLIYELQFISLTSLTLVKHYNDIILIKTTVYAKSLFVSCSHVSTKVVHNKGQGDIVSIRTSISKDFRKEYTMPCWGSGESMVNKQL